MIGAIIGDIIGSRFEPRNWRGDQFKSTEFELFTEESRFTDDTVCSCAIAELLLENEVPLENDFANKLHSFCRGYLDRGFGGRFTEWLKEEEVTPAFHSWGNGSAMRVSPLAWANDSFMDLMQESHDSAIVTHNHCQGVRGAATIAGCVWLARKGKARAEIEHFVSSYCYPLGRTIHEIRPDYTFDTSCKGSVPVAIQAFLESENFEDCVRLAVSVGGDSDTIASMAGALAHAYYGTRGTGVPKDIYERAMEYLTPELKEIVETFCATYDIPLFYDAP